MLNFKSKKIMLLLYFCALVTLILPSLSQAELGGSGSKAANEAAEQRATREKKLEKRKQEAEAKKAAEAQLGQPAQTETPPEGQQQDKPATQ